MKAPSSLVSLPKPERKPTYFVFAGLMFVPLTSEYLASWEWKDVDVRFQHLYRDGLQSADRREVVIVSHVLAHPANAGYHDIRGAIVERVNGQPIREIRDVVRAVRKPSGKLHVVQFDNALYTFGSHVVLKASEVEQATREVLATYGVTRDRSEDLEDGSAAPAPPPAQAAAKARRSSSPRSPGASLQARSPRPRRAAGSRGRRDRSR
jgi:hypothetical protein